MTLEEELKEIKGFVKWITKKLFARVYDELTFYVMSISLMLIYLSDPRLQSDFIALVNRSEDYRLYLIIPGLIVGIFYSIYHVFTNKKKSANSKEWMLYLALTLQLLTALFGLFYSINNDDVSIWFPFFNFIYAIIIYKLEEYKSLKLFTISDRNAKLLEVLLATITVGSVILLSTFLFQLHWIETLSISILLGNQISSFTHRMTSSILKLDI